MASQGTQSLPLVAGRYAIYDEIASGGMATVHVGRLLGDSGFARVVAVKRLLAPYARDPAFVAMFLDEARMAASVRHPNVVPTLDVVALEGELFLVMDYIVGESLAGLLRAARGPLAAAVAAAVACGVLTGLHAAHEAKDERGEPLGLVHRDVSPQNILVGGDGVPRVVDFGVAKAAGRAHMTREGQLKGKLPYMAPEYVNGDEIDRRADVWSASVVLWEMLTGKPLFAGASDAETFGRVLYHRVAPPSELGAALPAGLDEVVLRGLARDPGDRFSSAREMALAIEACVRPASADEVGNVVASLAGAELEAHAARLRRVGQAPLPVLETRAPSVAPGASSAHESSLGPSAAGPVPVAAASAAPASHARFDKTAGSLAAATVRPVRAAASRPRGLVLAGVLALGAVAGALYARAPSRAVASPSADAATPSHDPGAGVASAERAPPTNPSDEGAPKATPTTSGEGGPTATRAEAKPPAVARPVSRPRRTSPGHGDSCRVQDAAGIWHIKPGCL